MDLSTFFQKFDQFADAPDAVAKMRELVLELAVRGQLSERISKDQDDPVWRAFREETDNRIYSYDPGPPPPFDVPNEWRWVNMTEAAECRVAAKVDSNSLRDSDWVLDLEDIDGGAGKVIATATFADRRSLSTKASFQKGDVLYGKLRPYLNKVVIADRPGFCTTEIIPLRPQPFVAAGYLRFFLRSQTFLRYAAQKNYGMKIPRLGTKDLESAEIPLPPLAEQRRIVAKVDQLMALVDALETQLAASRATAANLLSALVAELTAATPSSTSAPASRADAPEVSREPEFIRSVFAAEIIEHLHAHDTFGQVKLQKVLHLAEYIFQLPEIDSHPLRYAAGPHDPQLIHEVQHGLRARDWFSAEPRPDGPGYVYRPLSGAGSHRDAFTQLWPEQAPKIRAFLDELRGWKTERCERFATLYAAWNDLLIWGQEPTDAAILEQVLEKWDPAKKRIPNDLWLDSLRWMREHGYTPAGFGRATTSAPQAELSF